MSREGRAIARPFSCAEVGGGRRFVGVAATFVGVERKLDTYEKASEGRAIILRKRARFEKGAPRLSVEEARGFPPGYVGRVVLPSSLLRLRAPVFA